MNELMKEMIKNYLEQEASRDELFKAKYENEDKSLEKCINYIFNQAKKNQSNILHHTEVFRMARDYYNDEVSQEDTNSTYGKCKVVGEDDAEDEYLEKHNIETKPIEKIVSKPIKKKEEKKKDYEQISLF